MSKADTHYLYGRALLWHAYLLGAVPFFSPRPANSTDPQDADCSGFEIGLWWRSGARFTLPDGTTVDYGKFFGTTRPTANTMYKRATPIEEPSEYGDLGFHIVRSGTTWAAKHVWHYADLPNRGPGGRTLEAGDGHGIVAKHTVAWQEARPGYTVVWGRVPHDLGPLTPASGNPTPPDWKVMREGASGQPVRELHNIINQLAGTTLTITNTTAGRAFGPKTTAALKKAQLLLGVPETGATDPACVAEMQRHLV